MYSYHLHRIYVDMTIYLLERRVYMITISEETKKTFQDRYPEFENACQAFFRQELPAGQYKGISGK